MTEDRPRILRHGGITQEQLESVIGQVDVYLGGDVAPSSVGSSESSSEHRQTGVAAPGMLSQHYSPTTPLVLASDLDSESIAHKRVGLLQFSATSAATRRAGEVVSVEVLTVDGNLTVAAASFFAALRRLDAEGLDLIIAEPFPDHGLGRALNDRLTRACHR